MLQLLNDFNNSSFSSYKKIDSFLYSKSEITSEPKYMKLNSSQITELQSLLSLNSKDSSFIFDDLDNSLSAEELSAGYIFHAINFVNSKVNFSYMFQYTNFDTNLSLLSNLKNIVDFCIQLQVIHLNKLNFILHNSFDNDYVLLEEIETYDEILNLLLNFNSKLNNF